jgi:hypothetical protein
MGTEVRTRGGNLASVPILILMCCFNTSGCSLTLFGVGAICDASKPEYEELKGKDLEKVPEDSEVSVLTVSGSSSKGRCQGLFEEENTRTPPTYLRLKTSSGLKDIDIEEIVYVRKKNTHNSKWGLLAAGIAVDAVVAYFVISCLRGLSSFSE